MKAEAGCLRVTRSRPKSDVNQAHKGLAEERERAAPCWVSEGQTTSRQAGAQACRRCKETMPPRQGSVTAVTEPAFWPREPAPVLSSRQEQGPGSRAPTAAIPRLDYRGGHGSGEQTKFHQRLGQVAMFMAGTAQLHEGKSLHFG